MSHMTTCARCKRPLTYAEMLQRFRECDDCFSGHGNDQPEHDPVARNDRQVRDAESARIDPPS